MDRQIANLKRQAPKPFEEMTQAEREAFETEMTADMLLEEMPYCSALEIAEGLIADPEEYGDAGSFKIAAALRARSSGHALAPMGKMPPATAPRPVKPPPIRSRPAKLEKPREPKGPTLL